MTFRRHIELLGLICWLTASVYAQQTIYVNGTTGNDTWTGLCETWDGGTCGPKATIQAGIDAAIDGDTVLVADGTYTGAGNKNLDFGGKAITVRSANGPESCIIDCENNGRGFYFHSGETAAAGVDGFTITNGLAELGGGIWCSDGSSPTIANCIITGNAASGADEVHGGGLYCFDASPTIVNCAINGNTASSQYFSTGGGICCWGGSNVTLTACTIEGNQAEFGGGIECTVGNATVTQCTIAGNHATSNGGAIDFVSSQAYIGNCVIAENRTDLGEAVRCWGSNPVITGCLISNNHAWLAAISCRSGASPAITNCTFTGNEAESYYGGAIYCDGGSPMIANSILWADTPNEIQVGDGSPVVTHSDIQGGWAGTGNIDADPGFLDPDGPDNDPATWEDNDYHLASTTCIDAGDNDAVSPDLADVDHDGDTSEPLPLDLGGLPRFADIPGTADTGHGAAPVVDMGAYEFSADTPLIAVAPSAIGLCALAGQPGQYDEILRIRNAGGGTLDWQATPGAAWLTATPAQGTSTGEENEVIIHADATSLSPGVYECDLEVSSAQAVNGPCFTQVTLFVGVPRYVPSQYATIQAAIDAALPGDTVFLADGTYTGAGNKNLDFGGKAITVRSANGPESCIIDCENDGRGFYFHSGETELAVVDSITVTRGHADYAGGAVYCDASNPTIRYCDFSANASLGSGDVGGGGAIYCESCSPTVVYCRLLNNSAPNGFGGALLCYESSPTIAHCEFLANTALGSGAIDCSVFSSPTIADCVISGNRAGEASNGGAGGGIACYDSSNANVVNCTIMGNTTVWHGGGVACVSSSPVISNCRIMDNVAADPGSYGRSFGGGISCGGYYAASPTIANCWITGNSAVGKYWSDSGVGGGIYCGYGTPTVTNCVIAGNSATRDGPASGGGIYAAWGAAIANCTIVDNTSSGTGGGIFGGSTITNCIVWGNSPEQVDGDDPSVTYCDVQGGWPGEGNIDVDPLLAFGDDEHLVPGSPCIDAGTNEPPGGLPPDDLEGNPRPLDGNGDSVATADIGAFEFNPAVQTLAVSPLFFSFDAVEGLSEVLEGRLWIRDAGIGTLNWDITTSCEWLAADPGSGASGGEIDEVAVTVNPAGLSPGQYACELTVVASPAMNSPRTVPVTLRVLHALHVPAEYPTIQAAIDAAIAGQDAVVVADGVYGGIGNQDLDFHGKDILVRSETGPGGCIIDCGGNGRGFYFHTGETADAVVMGFTITHGNVGYDGGGGIYSEGASPTILNCIVRHNVAHEGGGILCNEGSPTIAGCVLAGNVADWGGSAIECYYASDVRITNCTIAANASPNPEDPVAAIYVYSEYGRPVITNCIVWGNGPQQIEAYGNEPVIRYCDIQGGWEGVGNISVNPRFVAPGDLHLLPDSPCIAAGSNAAPALPPADIDGEPRVLYCRVDIGADESADFLDCNSNGIADGCDVAGGTSENCLGNGIPDECEPDCNANGFADSCDIAAGTSQDCNYNGVPDECDPQGDCNGNGVEDLCDIGAGTSQDCNGNSIPDECDIAAGASSDCDGNGVPDECESGDCNGNGVLDICEVVWGWDCNWNGVPDDCDLADGTSLDCNANSMPDECDLANCISTDVNANSIPDECESVGDVNCDGVTDFADINPFVLFLSNFAGWLAEFPGCDPLNGDINGDGTYGQGSFGDINPFVDLMTQL